MCISSVAAIEDNTIDNNLTQDSQDSDSLSTEESMELSVSDEEENLAASNTIIVEEVEENHNEMGSSGTIQKAIDGANAGDTVIINGRSYVHCHFVVNKKLTIRSTVGTTMEVCPSNTAESNNHGIFYISPEASGTVIEGFTLTSDVVGIDDYAILVKGASNVEIRNCSLSNTGYSDVLRVEDAKNTIIQNVIVSNGEYGIRVKNSQGTVINSNNIINNKKAGIMITGSSNNPTISFNNITNNVNGVDLGSSDNINILGNAFKTNKGYGVHVNCQVKKINVTGNFFYNNKLEEVFNDVNAKGSYVPGGEKLVIVNNNYVVSSENNRPVQREDSNGGGVFLGYIFEINSNVNCPIIYSSYGVNWDGADFELKLSNITQIKKGTYSISIVDKNGNIAKGLSSVPVSFYLNKNNNYVSPQEGDVYQTVMMMDGTATVKFYAKDFKESGNVLTAVFPGLSNYLTGDSNKNVKTFDIDDSSIPGNITESKITLSDITTYPKSNVLYTINLTDINNNPIVGEEVIFNINSKDIPAITDSNGQASIKINQKVGKYTVKVTYDNDGDYSPAEAQGVITVKKLSTKVVASNYAMLINKATYYQITLKDESGNAVTGQKLSIKVNKKTYDVKTNKKGVAKIKLKLKKGKYKVKITYKGSGKYLAAKKNTKITVKKVLKTKIKASKITAAPKTAVKYTVTLKDENGNAVKKQKVSVKINGKTYNKKTNSKGKVSISVKLPKEKTYKTTAAFKGSKIYQKSSGKGKITVKKIGTEITAPDMETLPDAQSDYTVTLKTSEGKSIAKQTIKIVLNGETHTKTTDSNGEATIQATFADEGTYEATVSYSGTGVYQNSNAVGKINVSRVQTQLISSDRIFSKGSNEYYMVTLKDESGNALNNQTIKYTLNNQDYTQSTDVNGQIKVDVSSLDVGSYDAAFNFEKTNQYKSASSSSKINILNETGITFIDDDLSNDEIQSILDSSDNPIKFLADIYNDVSLTIKKPLSITFQPNTTLNGKENSPVLTISASNINISDLVINAKEGSGIVIENAENVVLENNVIANLLNQTNSDKYNSGESIIPGNGIELNNAKNVKISKNDVKYFGNAIFAKDTNGLEINNNTVSLSNYGINYDLGVKNTQINNNLITKNIGLYVMDVPEGPLGYGIFFNQSAVNVSVFNNNISNNYMGISVDANYSTGIVITQNLICDNALEGIRFNAGYDLAVNAVEPDVNDNAIYRNAKGPSMMILGELSANPAGIYQYGPEDDTKKLHLGTNWYGKNARVTWDYDNNITGYGTMCPRIATTYISVKEIEVVSPGVYSISFYKNDEIASKLPVFEMYATLNDDVEVKFNVVEGVGTFSFDSGFNAENNVIKVSIGSLTDQYRNFEPLLNRTLETSEIPA